MTNSLCKETFIFKGEDVSPLPPKCAYVLKDHNILNHLPTASVFLFSPDRSAGGGLGGSV